jgi:hypothetical protein
MFVNVTYIYMHIHAYTYIYIQIHAYTYIYMHIHTYACIYIHIHFQVTTGRFAASVSSQVFGLGASGPVGAALRSMRNFRTRTRTHTHTHTHTHARTHTHTHTHTHSQWSCRRSASKYAQHSHPRARVWGCAHTCHVEPSLNSPAPVI